MGLDGLCCASPILGGFGKGGASRTNGDPQTLFFDIDVHCRLEDRGGPSLSLSNPLTLPEFVYLLFEICLVTIGDIDLMILDRFGLDGVGLGLGE